MDTTKHLLGMPPYPWQQTYWRSLVEQYRANKLPHALIVSAEDGLGIEKFALAFSQYVLCAAPEEDQACGKCKPCILLNSGNHPDLKVVVPDEKSEQLKVDQIRAVNEFLAQTSQQGAWKVVLLEPAHAMNQSAANALLKNLEEPAQSTLFLLVSTEPRKILPTLRSRCRQLSFSLPDFETASTWLQNNGVKNPQSLLDYLGNRPLLALEWSNENRLQEQEKIVAGIASLLSKRTSSVALAKQWGQYGALDLVAVLTRWLENEIRKISLSGKHYRGLGHLYRFSDRLRQKRTLLESSSNINPILIVDELTFDLQALSRIHGLFDPA